MLSVFNQNLKTVILSIFKLLLAVGLIYWMIQKGVLDLTIVTKLLDPVVGLGCFLCCFILLVINNARWVMLLRSQGCQISNRQSFPLTLIGMFFNYAVPGGVGGDVVKGYYLVQRFPAQKLVSATTVFMDRVLGMYGMTFMASIALLFDLQKVMQQTSLIMLGLVAWGLFFGMSAFFLLAFSSRLKHYLGIDWLFKHIPGGQVLDNLYQVIYLYGRNPKVFFLSIGISLFSQCFTIFFVFFFSVMTSDVSLPLVSYFIVVPLGLICTVLPLTPAGIGVGQAAFYYLFVLYTGIESQIGPNAITAFQVVMFVWGLVGVYFYITYKKPNSQ